MDINSQSIAQSGLVPLHPQTQQKLKSETRNSATTEDPVEDIKKGSNEQPELRPDDNEPQIDTYA